MSACLVACILLQSAAPAAQPAPDQGEQAQGEQAKVVSFPESFFAPYRPNTALDMLERLPGFTMDGGGGQRGFAGGEGNVRLDGQLPPSRGDNMAAILRRIPASSIERIDLVTGGAAGIDMQGQSVIANIVRKKGAGSQITVLAGASVYENRDTVPNARVEAQWSENDRLAEGVVLYYDDPFGTVGTRVRGSGPLTTSRFDGEVLNENARVSGAYETPFIDGRLRVNATLGQTDARTVALDFPTNATPPSEERIRQIIQLGEAGGRYSRNLDGGSTVEASYFHQYRRNDYDSTFVQAPTNQRFVSENRQTEDILRGVVRLPKRGDWAFDGGLEGAFNALDTASLFGANGVVVPVPNSQSQVEELRGELFGAAVWTAGPKFNVQMGLRLETSTISTQGSAELEKSLFFVKPRLIATWTPVQGHMAVLRIERTVDQLSFADFSASASLSNAVIVAGNPDIEPAENLIAEARYEHRFAGRGAFIVSVTRTEIDNLIARRLFPTPLGFIEAADNVGSGSRRTVYVSLTAPLESLGIKGGLMRLSHYWRSSAMTDPTTGETRAFSGETPWDWSIGFSHDVPNSNWRWGADVAAIGDYRVFQPRETTFNHYDKLFSAFVEYRPSSDTTIRLDALNITDRESISFRERYAGDRTSGVVDFIDFRDVRGLSGGRGVKMTVRKSY